MRLTIIEVAERDLDLRAEFWERRQPGLGTDYLIHLRRELNRLLDMVAAGEHSESSSDFHRFLTDRFSAQVFYEISDEELVIYGVFDCREAPDQIALDLSMR